VQAWEQFLTSLETELTPQAVTQWARALRVLSFDARNLYLQADDLFQINWFEEHIRPRLNRFITSSQKPIRVHLQMEPIEKLAPKREVAAVPFLPENLDPDLSFEQFLAVDPIIQQILHSAGEPPIFNPIFLYGEPSCGKSHFLMAYAQANQRLGRTPFFIRAQRFADQVVQAIRSQTMTDFRNTYRAIDCLLVDDIEDLARKTATQEEFFHTFNTLHTLGCPILITSSLMPSKLTEIEPRLISRFEWGLVLELKKIKTEAMLTQKLQSWKLTAPPELITFIAEKCLKHPVAALQTLRLRCLPQTELPGPEIAARVLKDILAKEQIVALTPPLIIQAVSAHYGIRTEDILSKSRSREFTLPRQVAIYLCRTKLKLAFQEIGRIFDRDHSTAMSSVNEITTGLTENQELGQTLERILRECSKR
jgi:chromosomal replication initiator protein